MTRRLLAVLLLCVSLTSCAGADHASRGVEGSSSREARAGAEREEPPIKPKISVTSPVLMKGGVIPSGYTCAADVWLPVRWGRLPAGTREVVLYFGSYGDPRPQGRSETVSRLVAAGGVIRVNPGLHRLRVGHLPAGASVVSESTVPICPPRHPGQRFAFTLYALSAEHRITNADLRSTTAHALLSKIGRESEAIGEFAARYPAAASPGGRP